MSEQTPPGDPFEFLKKMWGPMGQSLPGMVTPTLDVDEIDKRIAELKSVESWLAMNLNMLKMTIQGLEMQRSTLAAFKSMSSGITQQAGSAAPLSDTPAAGAVAWPWNLMPQTAPAQSPPAPKDQAPPDSKLKTRK
jgi:hypothetical protein